MADVKLITFNKGLLSPKVDVRTDVEAYGGGCRRLENMFATRYGGAEKRPGFMFIKNATTAPS